MRCVRYPSYQLFSERWWGMPSFLMTTSGKFKRVARVPLERVLYGIEHAGNLFERNLPQS
jgi:hypothetical protein